ncbi:MAG: hypothetical protein MJK04_01095 [Psychrosphaera sp.]|nr:hypothetical protein [Psychrosphaera sp.]
MKLELETKENMTIFKLSLPTKLALALASVIVAWSGSIQGAQAIAILQTVLAGH